MLSIKIEKEIKGENKVAFGLNLRQLCCVAAGVGCCIAVYQLTDLTMNELIVPFASIGVIAGAFGWVKKDGMMVEDYIKRYMEMLVYHNMNLLYKTQNRYVKMYNTGFIADRNAKAKDKSYQKSKKENTKKVRNFKSKIKEYN